MRDKALRTVVAAVLVALVTMLAIQTLFDNVDPTILTPISQAAALWVAWMIAWPLWFRYQPHRRFGPLGHAFIMLVAAGSIAAIRVAFRLG